jgi:hypothetical protein
MREVLAALVGYSVLFGVLFVVGLGWPWRSESPAMAWLQAMLAGVALALDVIILFALFAVRVPLWVIALALIAQDAVFTWRWRRLIGDTIMNTPRIFGREPALWIAAVQGLLMLLFTLGVPGIDGGLAAGVSLVLTAGATAWTALLTRPISPTVFTGLIVGAVQLGTRWGLDLNEVQVSTATGFVALLMTLVLRDQITPKVDPKPLT